MKVLRFKLKGKTAFFKKPDVNSYCYFTYGHIHKVALLGMFGAILGYKGYNLMEKRDKYPEFYSKLMNLNISIEPLNDNGFIPKKVQIFNNSVGYASTEQGGNLIVKEQWLENPKWYIYIKIDSKESEELAYYLINHKTKYIPYLGKNDHYADISEVVVFDDIGNSIDSNRVDSLFLSENFNIIVSDFNDNFEEEYFETYKYEENLPIGLTEESNMYIIKKFIYTNMKVSKYSDIDIYDIGGKRIVFY